MELLVEKLFLTDLMEMEGQALVEPIPLSAYQMPPRIADAVDLDSKTASVYIQDLYVGPGLDGVPKGVVRKLRVGKFGFSAHGIGGHNGTLGVDSSWDYRTLLGEVPVHPDGSTSFEIPANTPVFVQPLDEEGRAVQNMRSWFVGMPGEQVSCVGCHESIHQTPTPARTQALYHEPYKIEDVTGSGRPFSYPHDVEPIVQSWHPRRGSERHPLQTTVGSGPPGRNRCQPLVRLASRPACAKRSAGSRCGGNRGRIPQPTCHTTRLRCPNLRMVARSFASGCGTACVSASLDPDPPHLNDLVPLVYLGAESSGLPEIHCLYYLPRTFDVGKKLGRRGRTGGG